MRYLACGVCGCLLAVVVPEEPNGILTLRCPNDGDGKEYTTVTIDLNKTLSPSKNDTMSRSIADQIERGVDQRTD